MDQGLDLEILFNNADTLGKIQITKVDLTTDPCLPIPKSTANDMIGWILFIITFCLVTCLLEAYTARWRSQICNLFYPEIAKCRAAYLYNKIRLGRDIRKREIQQILTINLALFVVDSVVLPNLFEVMVYAFARLFAPRAKALASHSAKFGDMKEHSMNFRGDTDPLL